MRRHLSNYFKGLPNFKQTRFKLVTADSVDQILSTLDYIGTQWGDFDTSAIIPAPLSHDM